MTLASLLPVVPLAIVLVTAGLVAVLRSDDEGAVWVTGLGLAGAALALVGLARGDLAPSVLEANGFTTRMTIVICAIGAAATVVSSGARPHRLHLIVVLLMVAMAMVAIGSPDLLHTTAALAMVWTGAALVVGGRPDERGIVPVVRFVVGAAAAGTLTMFGAVLTFVATGTTTVEGVRLRAAAMSLDPGVMLLVAMAFMGAGAVFALVLLPLESAAGDEVDVNGSVGVLLSVATTTIVLVRLLLTAFDPIRLAWVPVVSALAGVLMIGGTIGAVAQPRIHRALAWLLVAYGGFGMAAVVSGVAGGAEAALLLILTWTAAITSAMVVFESSAGRRDPQPLGGLGWHQPATGLALTVSVLTLAGVPLTIGFVARWQLAVAMARAGRWDVGVVHAVAGALLLIVALRLIGRIWVRPAGLGAVPGDRRDRGVIVVALLMAGPLVVFGIWSSPLMTEAVRAAAALF